MNLSPKVIAIGSSCTAGLLWGGWAYFSNMDSENVWISASAQFLSSVILTSIISLVVYKSSSLFHGRIQKILLPAGIASAAYFIILFLVHFSVDTKNLWLTLSAPVVGGFSYSIIYSYSLYKESG